MSKHIYYLLQNAIFKKGHVSEIKYKIMNETIDYTNNCTEFEETLNGTNCTQVSPGKEIRNVF